MLSAIIGCTCVSVWIQEGWVLIAFTSCNTSHNSLRWLGQFGAGWRRGGWGSGAVDSGGRGKVKNGESPESTTEVGISAFLDRQFPMLPR